MQTPQTAPCPTPPSQRPAATKAPFLAHFSPKARNAGAPDSTKYPCFAPRREMYVLHREFGRVTEISMGGICFTYFDRDFFSAELPVEGTLFTNTDDYLDEIPFEVISDKTVSLLFASKYFLKERRIRFGELTANQIRQLERFILKNAHIPQLSYDTRYNSYKSVYASHS
jgi:hypothetical protein